MQERALNFGFGTLVIALLAAGTGRGLQQHDAQSSKPKAPAVGDAGLATPASTVPLLDDSIVTGTALLEEFFADSLDRLAPCTDPVQCYDLDVVIVTLPDPLDSFLDWAFDADLASMRRAFESVHYVTNRFWLPWDADRRVVKGKPPTQYRRSHPGVFLFRNSNPTKHRLRLVYVVGEISTGGIQKRAFEAALNERRALLDKKLFATTNGASDTIRVVGPFFTGSSLSTRTTLEHWRKTSGDSTSFALFVSGAATGIGNLSVFSSGTSAGGERSRVSFRATVNADVTLSLAMLKVMVDRDSGLGIPLDHIALIQESSTQYGQQATATLPLPLSDAPTGVRLQGRTSGHAPAADSVAWRMAPVDSATNQMLVIPYPMSISSLRAEYAKNPTPSNGGDELARAPEPRIPLALYDSNQQLESPIPVAQLTPASLELLIDEITRELEAQDIRAIGLIGTDVRDKIFLADQLRRRLPDARLFTFGSNDLYLREDYNDALRGMLVFSTYPLFLQNQAWDGVARKGRQRLAFASDDAEGVFNAVLRQLGRRRLVEYRSPFDSTVEVPPVWVTAVGRHSFIPVRAFTSLGGADEYLAKDSVQLKSAEREDHISHSDWVRWLTYIASAAAVLFLVVLANAQSRARIPIRPASHNTRMNGFPERRRCGLRAALLLHREIYAFLRHLALLCVFAALAVILVPEATKYEQLSLASPVVYSLLALMALAALVAFGARVRQVWRACGEDYRDYLYRPSHKWMASRLARVWRLVSRFETKRLVNGGATHARIARRRRAHTLCAERRAWRMEGIAIAIAAVVGILYAAAVATLIVDLALLNVPDATLLVYRATQLDSGVSPIFPIIVSSAALAILCTWQLSRLALLHEVTPFEEAFQLSPMNRSQTDADEIKSRIAQGLHAARIHLARVYPEVPSGMGRVFVMLFLVVTASALWIHFEPSFEAITPLRRMTGLTSFDVLFRLSVLMIFGAATLALVRLVMVWRALCVTLRALGASPLITAFERLPRRIARLTRLTLFTDPSQDTVLAVSTTQWMHLRRIFASNERAFERFDGDAADDVRGLMTDDAPLYSRDRRRAGVTFAPELKQTLDLIERFWATEPGAAQVDAVLADIKAQEHVEGTSTSGRIRRCFPDAVRLWVRSAEEFVAVQAVDYVGWALRHLRRLVLLLLFLLVVMMALLSSYSFLPQSVVRSLFLLLFLAVVTTLLVVLAQMNRDEVLSRVTRTDPGRVNWNSGFLINVGVVVAIPILSLLSTFSPLRTDLFGWVDVVLRSLSKH